MTKVIHSIAEWQQIRKNFSSNAKIGFVPTMGNLHEGHASLLKQARENDIVVVSIFVNPTQFNDKKDFQQYPKTFSADIKIAETCQVDYILAPSSDDIYSDGYKYKMTETELSQSLEGKHRPGHFDGVLTVVMKLFCLVKAHRAYFGEKDYQQLLLIQGLSKAFFLDTEVIGCPTLRYESGLPFSSRNNLLNGSQRKLADSFAYQLKSGLPVERIKENLERLGFSVDYVEKWQGRLFAAVRIGDVRLIDNIPLAQCEQMS